MASDTETLREIPLRENCFLFNAPDGDVSIDDLIDAVELTAGEDSVLGLQHMGGSKFLVCTRNAEQATKLIVAEGFSVKNVKVSVDAVGPHLTFVNVYRFPLYLADDALLSALQQFGKVKGVSHAVVANRQNKLNGVRVVRIEMSRPVPNFMTIQGHKVMMEYRGMRRVCARCGDDGHMATACTSPYCKRCGLFGHETEGCEKECKRCGGSHGTRDCFRKKSYVAAVRGAPPATSVTMRPSPLPKMTATKSNLQVLKPRAQRSSPLASSSDSEPCHTVSGNSLTKESTTSRSVSSETEPSAGSVSGEVTSETASSETELLEDSDLNQTKPDTSQVSQSEHSAVQVQRHNNDLLSQAVFTNDSRPIVASGRYAIPEEGEDKPSTCSEAHSGAPDTKEPSKTPPDYRSKMNKPRHRSRSHRRNKEGKHSPDRNSPLPNDHDVATPIRRPKDENSSDSDAVRRMKSKKARKHSPKLHERSSLSDGDMQE
ncbi:uncharacterized protein [Dermacentor andersoni]|uniref:uncharacterized protein n=1 Tax=Dermacentor andersoni TaxID=34620 RepID=UPI003B3A9328